MNRKKKKSEMVTYITTKRKCEQSTVKLHQNMFYVLFLLTEIKNKKKLNSISVEALSLATKYNEDKI